MTFPHAGPGEHLPSGGVSSHQNFAAAAEPFLAVVDAAEQYSRDEFVRALERALVDLYAAGLTLKGLQPDEDSPASEGQTDDNAAALQPRLGQKLGEASPTM